VPDGADLVAEAYGSEDFRASVEAFLEKRRHSWTGREARGSMPTLACRFAVLDLLRAATARG
jgi:hypothetical protein